MIYDGLDTSFRKVQLRPKQKQCKICGESPEIKDLIDYEQFCGRRADDKGSNLSLLDERDRISPEVCLL